MGFPDFGDDLPPPPPPPPLDDDARGRIAALAGRQRNAAGLLMSLVGLVGGTVEQGLRQLPDGFRAQVEALAEKALTASYDAAGTSRSGWGERVSGDLAHKVMASVSGAVGGFFGMGSALAEIPVATTLIFRAVQGVAAEYGEDPASEETRFQCLKVFGGGSPAPQDDAADTSFFTAKLGVNGATVHALIAAINPKFALILSQKLASQTVPVLGSVAGAVTNWSFTDYYTELAHVHFGLRQLARHYGESEVLEQFHRALREKRLPPA